MQALAPARDAAAPATAEPDEGSAFGMLLKKSATWAIIVANFVNHFNYFIYLNWMPMYFNKVLGFNMRASALYSFLPWVVMSAMSYVAGWVADTLVNNGLDRTTVHSRTR
jgi:sugar phosphate permease